MSWRDSNASQASALAAAEAHFPDDAGKVRQLFGRNEGFRSICEDLAAAEETLAHLDKLPDGQRKTRRQEYGDLVVALVDEIGEALSRANVLILRRTDEGRPRR